MSDLISRQALCEYALNQKDKSVTPNDIMRFPSAEPWSAIKTLLNELEQKEERIYSDYCDATARLKAIDKIAKSNQTMKRRIDGIVPLAERRTND